MNKWQKVFLRYYYHPGDMPKTKREIDEYESLAEIKDIVIVHFPEFKSRIPDRCRNACIKEYIVTDFDCDMPNGKISVPVLVGNLKLWKDKGCKIETA